MSISDGAKRFPCSMLLTKNLLRLRLKAIRCRVWFRVLSRVNRALIDLAIRMTDRIRSRSLARVVLALVQKLTDALESRVSRAVKSFGVPLACRLSLLGQKWGNREAKRWASDVSFARFLAVMSLNDPRVGSS
jgi:hypothetical protein